MKGHEALQPLASTSQQGERPAHAVGRPAQVTSPYLTSREALIYLRLNSLSALYRHIEENQLPVCRVGRAMRFDKRELDAWMRGCSALDLARARKRA